MKKLVRLLTISIALIVVLLLIFPGFKYWLYKVLPPDIRWDISYALTDKFVIGVVCFVEHENRLLLVKNSYQDKWALPGGWLNKGESFERAASRELREELGVEMVDIRVLEVRNVPGSQVVDVAVSGGLETATIFSRDREVSDYRFFRKSDLPENILYTHKPYIEKYLGRTAVAGEVAAE
ncbi:NUDIX hydrolase [Microbulbifer halophilus]|uniref:NUDIX hydrolase n=1 Tax=Microbulbifer halophilus TaxID=453963 RepID=A0ABW5EEU0_9GAMM|nr:NUDIX domain-containing protein [Microbulbifer halophilus]MCW8127420.1 NUDIX domain-containing protein [Microbulbifer halophilus]